MEERIQNARRHFADHHAKFEQHDGISTLDWRNKNGSSNYYVRYVFDEKHCHLYISGDLGSAVVRLTEYATLKSLSSYIESIYYFAKKVQCSTDLYEFDYDRAKEEVRKHLTDIEPDFDEDDKDAVETYEELMDEREDIICELMENFSSTRGLQILSSSLSKLDAICPDYPEWIYGAGECLSPRVIYWLVGLNMAYQQIKEVES